MYLMLDKQRMELKIVVGVLEKYEATIEIQDIHNRVKVLRDKMAEFMEKQIEPELFVINAKIAEENDKYVVKDDKIEE